MTLLEVLMVVAVVMLLGAFLLPALVRPSYDNRRIRCVNNLKQVGLAFRIWEADHGDRFPMQVSTNQGGTLEYVNGPNAYRHFQVMSNELNTPMILFCPNETDPGRTRADTFDTSVSLRAGNIHFSGNSNLSYFVGVDAVDVNPDMFLAGDRNVTNGAPIRDGMLTLSTNHPSGWTGELHMDQGNVCLSDGSVQMFTTAALREALKATGTPTNRVSLP